MSFELQVAGFGKSRGTMYRAQSRYLVSRESYLAKKKSGARIQESEDY